MALNFETPNGPLLDQPLAQPGLARERDNPENAEYTVGVDWIRTVPVAEAKWLAGLFANQNIVCRRDFPHASQRSIHRLPPGSVPRAVRVQPGAPLAAPAAEAAAAPAGAT
jgi:hypothetical protein